jgi:hypothetical protein
MTIKFRNDTNQRYTKALFYEQSWTDKEGIAYTLKDKDYEVEGKLLPSLYLLYMEECVKDPSEYTFASKHFDGWDHWLMVRDASWFNKPYYQRWKAELEVRIKSKALVEIIKESKLQTKNSFSINRFLLEKGWEPRTGPGATRGRPTKDDIKKATLDALEAQQTVSEDMKLLN